MSSQPQPPQPGDSPGPEFSPRRCPVAALERRLLEDGARWRADTSPPIAPFARRVNAALRERRHTSENDVVSAERPGEERPMAHRRVTLPPQPASSAAWTAPSRCVEHAGRSRCGSRRRRDAGWGLAHALRCACSRPRCHPNTQLRRPRHACARPLGRRCPIHRRL